MIRINLIASSVKSRIPQVVDSAGKSSFPAYVLSDIESADNPSVAFPTIPSDPLRSTGFAASSTLSVPRSLNPLRLISARFPEFVDNYADGTFKLGWYLDTLECGHQVVVFPCSLAVEGGHKRHRCAECAALAGKKKPVQSVPSPQPRKKAA